ncbi:MAG: family 16 glycosylhydrolase, partial [Chitinispirillaceae bacterium]|nr:family 16 glycosylhydrolase [Chitinispirillaceae bacterium]
IRNSELQYYTKSREKNARMDSGFLIIEAHREKMGDCDYTSASLITRGKREFQYGIFEMRAKIDIRKGSWPAFWTLGVAEEWPSNGEVDIMEYYNGALHANVAWGTDERWKAKWDSQTKSVDNNFAKDFHIWRMHWTEKFIELYVDDFKQNTTDLSQTINGSIAKSIKNPFHQKVYIVVNQAIGSNGGDPSGTEFPIRYIVDYIRVYQKGKDTIPPQVTGICGSADGFITILFSEEIEKTSAENISNYTIMSKDITISSVKLQSDNKIVVLKVNGLKEGNKYQISISNIRDNSTQPNIMVGISREFVALAPSRKLSGKIIGKGEPYNNNNNVVYEKALDDNVSTFADCVNDPVWVGYELGGEYLITELRYYPRSGYADRMNGRFFEVSTDGKNWEKIYTISEIPKENSYTSVRVVPLTPVKYVRYNGSGGYLNVAEVEFWGVATTINTIFFNGKKVKEEGPFTKISTPLIVNIFSADGRRIYSFSLVDKNREITMGKVSKLLDKKKIFRGIYITSLEDNSGTVRWRKVIFQP